MKLSPRPKDLHIPLIRTDLAQRPEWGVKLMWTKAHLMFAYLGVWLVVFALASCTFGEPGAFISVFVGFVGWAVFFLTFIAPATKYAVRRFDALHMHRCPACWTEIPDDAERDDIGLRRCPECGAWWRVRSTSQGKS